MVIISEEQYEIELKKRESGRLNNKREVEVGDKMHSHTEYRGGRINPYQAINTAQYIEEALESLQNQDFHTKMIVGKEDEEKKEDPDNTLTLLESGYELRGSEIRSEDEETTVELEFLYPDTGKKWLESGENCIIALSPPKSAYTSNHMSIRRNLEIVDRLSERQLNLDLYDDKIEVRMNLPKTVEDMQPYREILEEAGFKEEFKNWSLHQTVPQN